MSTTVQIKVLTFDGKKHTVRVKPAGQEHVILTPDSPSTTMTLGDAIVALSEFAPLAELEDALHGKPNDEAPSPVAVKPRPKKR